MNGRKYLLISLLLILVLLIPTPVLAGHAWGKYKHKPPPVEPPEEATVGFSITKTDVAAAKLYVIGGYWLSCDFLGCLYFFADISSSLRLCKYNGSALSYVGDALPAELKTAINGGFSTTFHMASLDGNSFWISLRAADPAGLDMRKYTWADAAWTYSSVDLEEYHYVPNAILRTAAGDYLVGFTHRNATDNAVTKVAYISGTSLVNTVTVASPGHHGSVMAALIEDSGYFYYYCAQDSFETIARFKFTISEAVLSLIEDDADWDWAPQTLPNSAERDGELPVIRTVDTHIVYQNNERVLFVLPASPYSMVQTHIAFLDGLTTPPSIDTLAWNCNTGEIERSNHFVCGQSGGKYWAAFSPIRSGNDTDELWLYPQDAIPLYVLALPASAFPETTREFVGAGSYIVARGADTYLYLITITSGTQSGLPCSMPQGG